MDRQSDGLVAFAFGRGNRRAYLSASIFHGCGEQTFGPLPNMLMLDGMVRIIPREDGSLLIRDLDMVSVCDDQEMAQLPVTGLRLRYDPERDILIWIRRNAENVVMRNLCAAVRPPPGAIVGTAGDDQIVGTPGPDIIFGLDGRDKIDGLAGNDIIVAGKGNDFVRGGAGHDLICLNEGRDIARGGGGNDLIDAGSGNDNRRIGVLGSVGKDMIFGRTGRDSLFGQGANRRHRRRARGRPNQRRLGSGHLYR